MQYRVMMTSMGYLREITPLLIFVQTSTITHAGCGLCSLHPSLYFVRQTPHLQRLITMENSTSPSDPPLLPLLESFDTRFQHSFGSSSSESSLDEDRCYLMEIEQLKRENNFLKKKIAQLSKRHPALTTNNPKRKSLPSHIKPPEHITALPQQNYVVGFFEEVTRLLETFSSLFRLEIGEGLKEELAKQSKEIGELSSANNGEDLSRKLGRVLLEPEEKRYSSLLLLFQEYYRFSTDRSRALREKVQHMTTSAIQLGKQMAERVRTKQRNRSSRILSSLDGGSALKSSFIKSTCTDSLDLSGCRNMLGRDKMFDNIF